MSVEENNEWMVVELAKTIYQYQELTVRGDGHWAAWENSPYGKEKHLAAARAILNRFEVVPRQYS